MKRKPLFDIKNMGPKNIQVLFIFKRVLFFTICSGTSCKNVNLIPFFQKFSAKRVYPQGAAGVLWKKVGRK